MSRCIETTIEETTKYAKYAKNLAMETEVLFREESYKIVGACFEVYREKGCGFHEALYQECMELELRLQGVPFIPQQPFGLNYKGLPLQTRFQPDFVCFDQIILEIKAVTEVTDEHRAQVMNYLKATGKKLGLLVNFGHYPKAQVERIVMGRGRYQIQQGMNHQIHEIPEQIYYGHIEAVQEEP
jgi:GxxExxY protein